MRVCYPAGCYTPCNAGFDVVRFAFAKGLRGAFRQAQGHYSSTIAVGASLNFFGQKFHSKKNTAVTTSATMNSIDRVSEAASLKKNAHEAIRTARNSKQVTILISTKPNFNKKYSITAVIIAQMTMLYSLKKSLYDGKNCSLKTNNRVAGKKAKTAEKQMRTNACLYLCVEYFDAWQGNAISQVTKAPAVLKPVLSIRPCARACDSLSSIFFTRRMWMLIILLSHQLKNCPIFFMKLGRLISSSFSIGQ